MFPKITSRRFTLVASLCVILGPLIAGRAQLNTAEPRSGPADLIIHVNQVAYDARAPKFAVVEAATSLPQDCQFVLMDAFTGKKFFTGTLGNPQACAAWFPGRFFYRVDFSEVHQNGHFKLEIKAGEQTGDSSDFDIGDNALAVTTIPSVTGFYRHQRASSQEEQGADARLPLFGSTNTVDLRGGWGDASGDVSKSLSRPACGNFMASQETPLVVWSMVNAVDTAAPLLDLMDAQKPMTEEALYGADYLMRSLAPDGFFYMTVFSYSKKDPAARRVVGLLADNQATGDYQCAYREGGGMAIAALARISQWHKAGAFTPREYLAAAERGFAHLQINNTRYDDDGKENIIDDYCALMAATELWIATGKPVYRDAARLRAKNLNARMTPAGYFQADDANRPFWHASDAGLPVIALARYLELERDEAARTAALDTIRQALDYNLRVTTNVSNPFGYARQSFLFLGQVREGFFMPHENEAGGWWQGENARLASLATAAIIGGRLVYPGNGPFGIKPELADFAANQITWILGGNPYDVCFMYQFGQRNVPYMKSFFGHGTGRGGISSGITGQDGSPDGSGIDWKFRAGVNECRWTEQWISHSAWFLQAVTAMSVGN